MHTTLFNLPIEGTFSASYREALYAGLFYSSNSVKLSNEIDSFLNVYKEEAPKKRTAIIDKNTSNALGIPNALVVPHAGYAYSGDAAAAAYSKLISENKKKFKKVILLGPHHRVNAEGFTIMKTSAYSTPLGQIPIHRDALELVNKGICSTCIDQDHCLEVQLPFLQKCLETKFEIIPILAGHCGLDDTIKFTDRLTPYITEDTLIVISTDFIHYGPRFMYTPFGENPDISAKMIKENDLSVIESFKKGNYKDIFSKCHKMGLTICGKTPLIVLSRLVNLSKTLPLLHKYYNSGDVTGDHTNTVSYAALSAIISIKN